ncbi:unnamed protein product [Arabidopsis thaliana]|uniref:(thale cress) hypothetical protein n=1 Tax=Arabidopsis thaliana TaxID=3702 RepID=A0A7G2EQ56_ARATH|nr:unnamed protein product [Arabidopsis thaliana]
MDSSSSVVYVGSSSKSRNFQSKSKGSITSFSIDSRGTKKSMKTLLIPEPEPTSPEVIESSVSSVSAESETPISIIRKKKQSEPRFYSSPTNTFYTEAKQSFTNTEFSECASISTIAHSLRHGFSQGHGHVGYDKPPTVDVKPSGNYLEIDFF